MIIFHFQSSASKQDSFFCGKKSHWVGQTKLQSVPSKSFVPVRTMSAEKPLRNIEAKETDSSSSGSTWNQIFHISSLKFPPKKDWKKTACAMKLSDHRLLISSKMAWQYFSKIIRCYNCSSRSETGSKFLKLGNC